jgi:PHD/YefM family antitoxin component YafN of YafNO toxin-antitoxin module
MFRVALATDPPTLRIRTDELRTVREAMRDFGTMLTELEGGEVEKLVLTQRNRMRAVVVSVERWSELERALEDRSARVDVMPGESTDSRER